MKMTRGFDMILEHTLCTGSISFATWNILVCVCMCVYVCACVCMCCVCMRVCVHLVYVCVSTRMPFNCYFIVFLVENDN